MPIDRSRLPYAGRYAQDTDPSGVYEGYQRAAGKLDTDQIRRNIKPYQKYGFTQSLRKLAGMSDWQRYLAAQNAVLREHHLIGQQGGNGGGSGSHAGGTSRGAHGVHAGSASGTRRRSSTPARRPASGAGGVRRTSSTPRRSTTPSQRAAQQRARQGRRR